jgi:hypothetical protein
MFIRLEKRVLALLGLAVTFAACDHETTEVKSGSVRTTAAVVIANDTAVLDVAKARCRRADECNRLGNGHEFADREQCVEAFATQTANANILNCENGVNKAKLDKCISELANQYCDAHMGPITAMPHCASYCSPGE